MSLPCLIALALLPQASPTPAEVWNKAVDQGFSGGAIVVSGNETLLFDIKNTSPSRALQITKDGGIPVCSVTKGLTAEVILGLVKNGQISLDGTVQQYVSGLPKFAGSITVRQLLTHTSGLRNMDSVLGADADGVGAIYRSYDASLKDLRSRVVKILGDRTPSEPGAKYDYNNSDFLVLQLIAEDVTHQSYEKLLQDFIFSKARMKRTHLAKWDPADRSFVSCFQKTTGGETSLKPFNMAIYGGAAGLISTPRDLAQWMKFTLNSPLGRQWLNSGSQYGGFQGFGSYAYPTGAVSKALQSDRKEPAFERPGAVNGYGLQVSFLPERNLAVAVFSNREGEALGSIFEGKGLAFDLIVAASRTQVSSRS